ncbi:hypothetical protein LTR66_011950 [Elasticomyces elasticus]|nr:hypothetical protein LTR66_011950 [Elasticomyces elasticus]
MSHTIFVHNKSGHNQEFEVHGWNSDKNITVPANSTTTLTADDGSSGAIIALHDGREGEQAEITKNGFGGNDFFDISNIVGAGGNITAQQVGDPSTLKGDPRFMQDLNEAWHNATQAEKDGLASCVHLDSSGNVVRIDPIKFNPLLDPFIRKFADGQTYIGVGAWRGSPGVASDNNQSMAGHGDKDILVTYNDDDATPDGNPGDRNSSGNSYTIQPGDTFYGIRLRFGISVDDIVAKNPGVNPNELQVGQVIHLR